MIGPTKARKLGTPAYHAWRNEVVLDLGDFTFTRNELNDLGMGLHTNAAGRLDRISRKNKTLLGDYRRMGMDSIWRTDGIGQTTLILIGYLLCAAFPDFDLDKWVGNPARSIAGGVRANTHKKKA